MLYGRKCKLREPFAIFNIPLAHNGQAFVTDLSPLSDDRSWPTSARCRRVPERRPARRRYGVNLDSQHVAASGRLALLNREHEIEPGRLLLAVVGDRHQQPAIEQGIASIAPLVRKVQLGGEDRPVGRLHRHMEVPCASRI
jgi:hypothetical protein